MKLSFLLLFTMLAAQPTFADPLITWTSQESMKRFARSKHKVDFFPISNNFETQSNGIYCGPTSAVIILNAFRLRKKSVHPPKDFTVLSKDERQYLPKGWDATFEKYTQRNVFINSKKVKSKQEVLGRPLENGKSDFGFQLRQLHSFLIAHNLDVDLRVVSDTFDSQKIKTEIINNLKTANDFVVINYKRQAMGQKGGGHFSPLGAYDKVSDSFLIMDVNSHQEPWVWISSKDLIASMRTFDTIENRGYLLIRDRVKSK